MHDVKGRKLDVLGFVAWGLLTAALTLSPSNEHGASIRPLCLLCGELGGADLIRNILLFAPAGFLLSRRGGSMLGALLLGVAISTSIEVAQLFVPGRFPTLRDVLTNGIGAGAGVVFHRSMAYGLRSGSRALLAAAAAFPVAIVALTGWLMQPVSTDAAYFAQWVPERAYYAPWRGRVLSAQVGPWAANIGRLDDSDAIRRALEQSDTVRVQFVEAAAPDGLTAIFVIMDADHREVLMVGAQGNDLVVRPRRRASDARLALTDQRFSNFLDAHASGDSVSLEVTTDGHGRSCVRSGAREACAPPASLGAAWELILWKGALPLAAKRGLHGLTVFLLLVPLALLCAGRTQSATAAVFVPTVLACVAVGRLLGLEWPGVAEVLAAVLVPFSTALMRRMRVKASTA